MAQTPGKAKRRELTFKQQRFVDEYIKLGNAVEAYKLAYDCTNMKPTSVRRAAKEMLRHPVVSDHIASYRKKSEEDAIVTRRWVLDRLMKNAQMALGEIPTPVSVKNKETGEFETVEVVAVDIPAANKSLELLGKLDTIGMFVDRQRVTVDNEFEDMTDDELERFVEGDEAPAPAGHTLN